jgi:cytoskeletal protein RodZ
LAKHLLNSPKEPHRLLEDFVKKKIQSLTFLATLAVAIGMISWGSALNAQTSTQQPDTSTPQSTPDTTPQQPSPDNPPAAQQPPSSQAPDTTAPDSGSKASSAPDSDATGTGTQTFSGTVVKQGSKYVLKDDSGKTYDIDHQTDVAKFEGKRVRVQGTLDANGKIIVK